MPITNSEATTETYSQLCLAARTGDIDQLNHLLSRSTGGNELTKDNCLPFRIAAENGHLDVVDRLLRYQVIRENLTAVNYALCVATQNGHINIIKRLLACSSNHDILLSKCYLVMCRLGTSANLSMLNSLLELPTFQQTPDLLLYALGWAASTNKLEFIDRLLELPIVRENLCPTGFAFTSAVKVGNLDVLNRYLDIDVVLEKVSQNIIPLLHLAAERKHPYIIKCLLTKVGVISYNDEFRALLEMFEDIQVIWDQTISPKRSLKQICVNKLLNNDPGVLRFTPFLYNDREIPNYERSLVQKSTPQETNYNIVNNCYVELNSPGAVDTHNAKKQKCTHNSTINENNTIPSYENHSSEDDFLVEANSSSTIALSSENNRKRKRTP